MIKQRVARAGQGRSGGYRTLIAVRFEESAVFLFGFAKNDREQHLTKSNWLELRLAARSGLPAETEPHRRRDRGRRADRGGKWRCRQKRLNSRAFGGKFWRCRRTCIGSGLWTTSRYRKITLRDVKRPRRGREAAYPPLTGDDIRALRERAK